MRIIFMSEEKYLIKENQCYKNGKQIIKTQKQAKAYIKMKTYK